MGSSDMDTSVIQHTLPDLPETERLEAFSYIEKGKRDNRFEKKYAVKFGIMEKEILPDLQTKKKALKKKRNLSSLGSEKDLHHSHCKQNDSIFESINSMYNPYSDNEDKLDKLEEKRAAKLNREFS